MTHLLADDDAPRILDLPDGGVRFVLPRRKLGVFRWIGGALIALPLLFALIPLGFVLASMQDSDPSVFMLSPLAILVPLLALVVLGLFMLIGHSEVEVNRRQLLYVERVGPFRKRWSRPLEAVSALRVAGLSDADVKMERSQGQLPDALRGFAVLLVRCDGAKVMPVAAGYERTILQPLAEGISQRAASYLSVPITLETAPGAAAPDGGHGTPEGPTAVRGYGHGTPRTPLSLDDLPDPPAGATAQIDRHDLGFTIRIPPVGVRGAKGLFGFSLLWCGFMTLFTGAVGYAVLSGDMGSEFLIFAAVIALFWAIGIGMLVGALNMARRRAIIDLVGKTLLVSREGIFGTKQHEWAAEAIRDIRVGPSGMKVNDRPIMNLRIATRDGETVGLFSERTDDELEWIAMALRTGLAIESRGAA